ncbi:MAG: glycosyltransferase family 2 protein [Patescibacteria group bacterium]
MKTAVIIPNWNGADFLAESIDSLLAQTVTCTVIVVDNGSKDQSIEILEAYGDKVTILRNEKNLGFSGGVNTGIRYALKNDYDAVALLNNDAVADRKWLEYLSHELRGTTGIVTSLILSADGSRIDTTGESLSVWGLAFPRGRGKEASTSPLQNSFVFGASGGASLYSVPMLKEIGLFDEDFFAYYEDIDLSFRAQLTGWKVIFVPTAMVRHKIGATSGKVRGLTTYHTFKNMRLLIIKNTPDSLKRTVYPRFYLAYSLFQLRALLTRNVLYMVQGSIHGIVLTPKKIREGKLIRQTQSVSDNYIAALLTPDLPERSNIRKLRSLWWKLIGR